MDAEPIGEKAGPFLEGEVAAAQPHAVRAAL